MEPTIYKPSIYKGAGIYKTGAGGGGNVEPVLPDSYRFVESIKRSDTSIFNIPIQNISNDGVTFYQKLKHETTSNSLGDELIFALNGTVKTKVSGRPYNAVEGSFQNGGSSTYYTSGINGTNLTAFEIFVKNDSLILLYPFKKFEGNFTYSQTNLNQLQVKMPYLTSYFRWYAEKDGTYIFDFRPVVRISDGIIGLFDMIGQKFFTDNKFIY